MPVNPKSIKNLKPAQKGEVRNPHGAPKKLPDLETAMAQIMGEEKDGKTALEAILAALRAKAAKGDIRAAEVLLNRGYGLPTQKITGGLDLGLIWKETKTYEAEHKADESP